MVELKPIDVFSVFKNITEMVESILCIRGLKNE